MQVVPIDCDPESISVLYNENNNKILGTSDFIAMVQSSLYVDKSLFLKTYLESEMSSVLLLTRPRRFGKSSLFSMLYYFLGNRIDDKPNTTRPIFERLMIGRYPELIDKHHGKYSVIYLNFATLNLGTTKDSAQKKLSYFMSQVYNKFSELKYSSKIDQDYYRKIISMQANLGELQDSLRKLTLFLQKHYDETSAANVYILIDEYETPYSNDIIKNLLNAALKDNICLHKALLTGIFNIVSEKINTGLNNIGNATLLNDQRYNSYFGICDYEVPELLKKNSIAIDFEKFKTWYAGYKVGLNTYFSIFPSWSVMSFINNNINKSVANQDYNSHWTQTSSATLLDSLVENVKQSNQTLFEEIRTTLLSLFEEKEVFIALENYFSFSELENANLKAFWTLLHVSGYITVVEKTKDYRICIPNQDVRQFLENKHHTWFSDTELKLRADCDTLLNSKEKGPILIGLGKLWHLKGNNTLLEKVRIHLMGQEEDIAIEAFKLLTSKFKVDLNWGKLLTTSHPQLLAHVLDTVFTQASSNTTSYSEHFYQLCLQDLNSQNHALAELKLNFIHKFLKEGYLSLDDKEQSLLPILLKGLAQVKSENSDPYFAMLENLKWLNKPEVLEKLCECLSNESIEISKQAFERLKYMKQDQHPLVKKHFFENLKSENLEHFIYAASYFEAHPQEPEFLTYLDILQKNLESSNENIYLSVQEHFRKAVKENNKEIIDLLRNTVFESNKAVNIKIRYLQPFESLDFTQSEHQDLFELLFLVFKNETECFELRQTIYHIFEIAYLNGTQREEVQKVSLKMLDEKQHREFIMNCLRNSQEHGPLILDNKIQEFRKVNIFPKRNILIREISEFFTSQNSQEIEAKRAEIFKMFLEKLTGVNITRSIEPLLTALTVMYKDSQEDSELIKICFTYLNRKEFSKPALKLLMQIKQIPKDLKLEVQLNLQKYFSEIPSEILMDYLNMLEEYEGLNNDVFKIIKQILLLSSDTQVQEKAQQFFEKDSI